MTLGDLERKVLEKIKPTPQDYLKAEKAYTHVADIIQEYLDEKGIAGRVELEGSIAKDTWLKTEPELDVFIILEDRELWGKKEIEGLVEELSRLFKKYDPQMAYAEHPYLKIRIDSFKADIVPALRYRAGEKIRTAVDRTPIHTKYIKENTSPQLRDEIRVAKQFARRIGVYGAEIRVKGFSGYLIELLVIHYGGFRELLENASKWKPPIQLGSPPPRTCGSSPMCLADPTDRGRNVAASVSLKRIAEFSLAARLYLEEPSINYFFPQDKTREIIKDRISLLEPYYPHVVLLEVKTHEKHAEDNLWGMMERATVNAKMVLENSGFKVLKCETWCNGFDKGMIACLLEQPLLTNISGRRGPPFYKEVHADRFLKEYVFTPLRGPWVGDDGRLYSISPRKAQHPVDVIEENIGAILVSGLKKSEHEAYMLSWRPEVLGEGERGEWLSKFIYGKPEWLIPYIETYCKDRNP